MPRPTASVQRSSESKSKKKDRVIVILDALARAYDHEFEGLDHSTPFELLIATILSAQSTDKLVNTVTPALFAKYPTPLSYVQVPVEEIEQDIRSTGYYRAKARNIRACCQMLQERFDGQVPGTMEDLVQLPGVGRKTANCVLAQCFGKQTITVDTHVTRITNLLGLVATTDAVKIEFALMDIVPEDRWNEFNSSIITHGRRTCIARRTGGGECVIAHVCPSRVPD
ncbi:MAG: endonuclease III [Candidatus Kapaibacterium sp.]